jgi:primosomal protein N' (replication factor Y)
MADHAPLYAVVMVQTSLQRAVTASQDGGGSGEDEDQLTRAFHYLVPEPLRAQLLVGHLVWVPFGARTLQGIVVAFADASPVEENKEIESIADPHAVLSPELITLAQWISAHYLAPMPSVVQNMLPPGVLQAVEVLVQLRPDIPVEHVTEAQGALLALLRAKGPLTLRQLTRLSKRSNAGAIANQLVAHGWATKSVQLASRAKPKLVAVVRLRAGVTIENVPERSTSQRQALEHLLARAGAGVEWLPLAEVAQEAGVPTTVLRTLVGKGLLELEQRQVWRDPLAGQSFVSVIPPALTPEQEAAWHLLRADLDHPAGKPFLLQGVTGSGKTELYLRAVQHVLNQGRGAIVLVPEISLTPQTIRRFGARFPTTIAVMHSRLTPGERYDQWRRLRQGELRLVVGARSALFSPVDNLGLIVLDEEHEWSYKQAQRPHYHAREAALRLAQQCGATCLLGSATPDLESAYRAERGEYVRLLLPQRVLGHRQELAEQAAHLHADDAVASHYHPLDAAHSATLYTELPPVQIVDMRAELRQGNRSIFSRPLHDAITVALAARQQIILFLNRRGEATFVNCRDCGHVLRCPRCDIPLTYHSAADDLICHHCNYRTFLPPQCPQCWSGRIRFFGAGTQRVEELARETFPTARIVRWDLDTTGGKGDHEQYLDRFIKGEADIMVGTQMIAKGLDLPQVTVVGIVAADTTLNLPDFRAGERTFQLLTQVAGRAGRSILGGKVILQTYAPDHPILQTVSHHDYDTFYAREIAFRRERWYPPLSRLIQLIYSASNAAAAEREAQAVHRQLTLRIARLGLVEVDLIGPAPAFFARLRGKYRWQLVVRGSDPNALLREWPLPLGWQADVDPVSLL